MGGGNKFYSKGQEMRINCKIHAKEMQLLGLRRQLAEGRLDEKERENLLREIASLERSLGLQVDENAESPSSSC